MARSSLAQKKDQSPFEYRDGGGRSARWDLYYPSPSLLLNRRIVLDTIGDMQLAHRQTERFRKNLAALCSEHGDIQKIAATAKMTRAYISNIIHGKVSPSLENAAKIADACELSLTDMLAEQKEFSRLLQKTA